MIEIVALMQITPETVQKSLAHLKNIFMKLKIQLPTLWVGKTPIEDKAMFKTVTEVVQACQPPVVPLNLVAQAPTEALALLRTNHPGTMMLLVVDVTHITKLQGTLVAVQKGNLLPMFKANRA